MSLVAQLLVNPEFQKVLAVHNKIQETWCLNRPPTPHSPKSQELVSEVSTFVWTFKLLFCFQTAFKFVRLLLNETWSSLLK